MRLRPAAVLAVASTLLLPALAVEALPDPDKAPRYFDSDCTVANDRRFVHDFIGLLDEVEGAFVEERACALYQATSAHLVLALVPDLEGQSLEVYALRLFEAWGIGDDERLDGLLVLYAADDGTNTGSGALRIEVGYGLDATVAATTAREAYDTMVDLKRQKMDEGLDERDATAHALAAGSAAMADYLIAAYDDGFPAKPTTPGDGFSIPWWVWVLVAVVVLSVLMGGRRGRGFVFLPPIGGGRGGMGGGGWGGKF